MDHPFNMYTIISMYTGSYFRVELLTIAKWRKTPMVTCQINLGFKIQKTNLAIRIRIFKIPSAPIFRQNGET